MMEMSPLDVCSILAALSCYILSRSHGEIINARSAHSAVSSLLDVLYAPPENSETDGSPDSA